MPKRPLKKPPANKHVNRWLWAIKWLTILSIWGIVVVGLLVLWFGYDLPDANKLLQTTRKPGVVIVTKKGELIATYGDIYGQSISAKSLPPPCPQCHFSH